MTISYRKATAADTPAIQALLEQSKLPTESVGGDVTEFFLAESEGVLIGVAGFEYYGDDALLRSVAVPAHLQSEGIGSQLVDWMLHHAREQNIGRIVLLTETAEKFFRKKGFLVVDRATIRNDALRQSSEFSHVCPSSSTTMTMELR
jgi:amino-acid N-acetyltransferase